MPIWSSWAALILHQGDEGRDYDSGFAGEHGGGKLITEGFAAAVGMTTQVSRPRGCCGRFSPGGTEGFVTPVAVQHRQYFFLVHSIRSVIPYRQCTPNYYEIRIGPIEEVDGHGCAYD